MESLLPGVCNRSSSNSRRRSVSCLFLALLLGLAGAVAYLPFLGSYGPLDPTDSFFIESTREMIQTHQYLLPMENYSLWLDKPILYFWLAVVSAKVLGVTPFAVRLVGALSGIFLSYTLMAALSGLTGWRVALFSALIFLSLPLGSIIAHVALTDMVLTLHVTAALFLLYRGASESRLSALSLGYVMIGLGMLCKGPIALILVGLTIGSFLLVTSSSRQQFFKSVMSYQPLMGVALMAAVTLPWYLLANYRTNGEFFHDFFLEQNFGRMAGVVNHQEPFWFYIPMVLGGLFPWSLFLFTIGPLLRAAWRKRLEGGKLVHLTLFCLCWAVSILGLFSALSTKLPTYILPACPAIAVLVGLQLYLIVRRRRSLALVSATAGLVTVACIVVLGLVFGGVFHGYVEEMLKSGSPFLIAASLGGGIVMTLSLKKMRMKAVSSLLALSLLTCAALVPQGLMSFYKSHQEGFNELVENARSRNASLGIMWTGRPSACFIMEKPVPRIDSLEEADKFIAAEGENKMVICPDEMINTLEWLRRPCTPIAKFKKWHLLQVVNK